MMSLSLRAAFLVITCSAGSAAFACPDLASTGQQLSYTSDQAYAPRVHPVLAGGGVDLSACGSVPGLGFVATAPDFELTFTGNGMGRALELRVIGSCDTVLLVNDARSTWHYSDDDSTVDPRIRLERAPEGLYDIWVGTFGPDLCNAELVIETF
jgi:hypothetical protein